jgi:ribonuclease VapC
VIAIDTSALIAIVLAEPEADRCMATLEREDRFLVSAATIAEALIVGRRRGVHDEITELIEGLRVEVVNVTEVSARRTAEAYARWGRGADPAGLNFGDCFAYEVAREFDCPLLYVGEDFARTDMRAAI